MDLLLSPPITIVLLVVTGLMGFFAVRARDAYQTGCAGCLLLAIAIGVMLFGLGLTGLACASNPCGNAFEILWDDSPAFFVVVVVVAASGVGLLMLARLFAGKEPSMPDSDGAPPADQD
jgi:NO-binding membrane sensor protein with MHYT domain